MTRRSPREIEKAIEKAEGVETLTLPPQWNPDDDDPITVDDQAFRRVWIRRASSDAKLDTETE